MACRPDGSLPQQTGGWGDLLAAYRLFNNERIEPGTIQLPHYQRTRQRCSTHRVVLCVQDTSTLDYTHHKSKKGLGSIERQNGQGLLQHSVLAVLPNGQLLGVLNQRWQVRVDAPKKESRKQRRSRWRESLFWAEGVEAVGSAPPGTRFLTVTDRNGDCVETFDACGKSGHGWVIRAQHDRCVNDGKTHLWSLMQSQPILKTIKVNVPARAAKIKTNKGLGGKAQPARRATVAVRVLSGVLLDPPKGDTDHKTPRRMNVVYASEVDPPADVEEPIDWMLLTSEPVSSARQALTVIGYYRCRWIIEEYHKVQKQGCRLEKSQLRDVDALRRLAAIVGVSAVRLLWLRDLASQSIRTPASPKVRQHGGKKAQNTPAICTADDPKMLRAIMPPLWITVAARLLGMNDVRQLTPRQFWRAIAQRGGWIGRKSDGRPGWKVLWQGWHDMALLVEGAMLADSGKG
jgi:hypothetical protein